MTNKKDAKIMRHSVQDKKSSILIRGSEIMKRIGLKPSSYRYYEARLIASGIRRMKVGRSLNWDSADIDALIERGMEIGSFETALQEKAKNSLNL